MEERVVLGFEKSFIEKQLACPPFPSVFLKSYITVMQNGKRHYVT